jgi:DNA-directed RNA polymerase subunit RPC12/RpoP
MASKRFGETSIGFMEKRDLTTLQLSCSECHKIFYYVNEENDEHKPAYCPECGRRNAAD